MHNIRSACFLLNSEIKTLIQQCLKLYHFRQQSNCYVKAGIEGLKTHPQVINKPPKAGPVRDDIPASWQWQLFLSQYWESFTDRIIRQYQLTVAIVYFSILNGFHYHSRRKSNTSFKNSYINNKIKSCSSIWLLVSSRNASLYSFIVTSTLSIQLYIQMLEIPDTFFIVTSTLSIEFQMLEIPDTLNNLLTFKEVTTVKDKAFTIHTRRPSLPPSL